MGPYSVCLDWYSIDPSLFGDDHWEWSFLQSYWFSGSIRQCSSVTSAKRRVGANVDRRRTGFAYYLHARFEKWDYTWNESERSWRLKWVNYLNCRLKVGALCKHRLNEVKQAYSLVKIIFKPWFILFYSNALLDKRRHKCPYLKVVFPQMSL